MSTEGFSLPAEASEAVEVVEEEVGTVAAGFEALGEAGEGVECGGCAESCPGSASTRVGTTRVTPVKIISLSTVLYSMSMWRVAEILILSTVRFSGNSVVLRGSGMVTDVEEKAVEEEDEGAEGEEGRGCEGCERRRQVTK